MRFFQRRIVGIVDTRGSRIQGWCFDRWTNNRVGIDIYVDGRKIGETIADRYRADLVGASPDGQCAFEFLLPPELLDDSLHTVEVRPRGSRRPLTNGRFKAHLVSNDYFIGIVRRMLRSGMWRLADQSPGGPPRWRAGSSPRWVNRKARSPSTAAPST